MSGPVSLRSFEAGSARVAGLAACCCAVALVAGCGSGIRTPASSSAPAAVSDGPQLGYAWKADDKTFRPILGIPGSSQVGESVVPAAAYSTAGSSAISSVGLLIGTDGQLYRMALPGGSPVKLGVTVATDSQMRFSPSGKAALVFVPGATSVNVVTGLAGSTSSAQVHQVTAGAALVDAAPSDAGLVAAVVGGSSREMVALLSTGASAQPLAYVGAAGGLSFVGAGDDLLTADAAAGTLTLIRSASTTAVTTQLPTGGLLHTPIALSAASNGRWAVVANGAEASVVRIDLTGASAPQRVVCPAQPTVVEQLAGTASFRFTAVGASPAWISDVSKSSPAMLFVPARP